jgi:hypothetical protein
MGASTVVILESGGRCPAWLGDDPTATKSVEVLAQRQSETIAAFRSRAARRISALTASTVPTTAILICGSGISTEAFAFRHSLLQKLLAMMQRAGRGHIVVATDGDQAQKRRLACLAAGLSDQLDDESMVSVRFRALSPPPKRVGIFATSARRVA